jgi:hypothetical protein
VKQLIDAHRAEQWTSLDLAAASVEQIAEATGRDFNHACGG